MARFRKDFLKHGLEPAGRKFHGKMAHGPLAAGEAHLAGALRIGKELAHGAGHGGGIAHGHEQAGYSVNDYLRHAAAAGGDDGLGNAHGLDDDLAEGLAGSRSMDEDVELIHELGNVRAEAHELDAVLDLESPGQGADFAIVVHLAEHGRANDLKLGGWKLFPNLGGGREKDVLPLPGRYASD